MNDSKIVYGNLRPDDGSKVEVEVTFTTPWERVLNAARRTVGKEPLDKEPSKKFKKESLMSEHSPLRMREYDIVIKNIPMWVTVHLVRHFVGYEKFVHTQREDRTQLQCSRDELPQGALNDMQISCNAQALINVSKFRLCNTASKETRRVWELVKEAIAKVDPLMAQYMVRRCVYLSRCPEPKCCGFIHTKAYGKEHDEYFALMPKDNINVYRMEE